MTLKSIEKYFARYTAPEVYPWVSEMLRDIQDEVDSRYMELPVDADGVPIHPGNHVEMDGKGGEVWLVGMTDVMCNDGMSYRAVAVNHRKQRTVENVLRDAGVSVAAVSDVAAEIRELLEVRDD